MENLNKEKQIEEMAKDMCEYYYEGTCYQDKKPCDCKCDIFTDAQYLYAKGYRKASDVAEEIFAEIEEEIRSSVEVITTIKDEEEGGWYDGELNMLGMFGNFLAELKKKYTQEK